MQAIPTVSDGDGLLRLSGRFDFNAHRDFRAAYEPLIEDVAVRIWAASIISTVRRSACCW